jgi:hypothetical protein
MDTNKLNFDVFPDFLNFSREFSSRNCFFGFENTRKESHKKGVSSDCSAVCPVYRRGTNFYQYFVVSGNRFGDLFDLKNIRVSIPGVYYRFHANFSLEKIASIIDDYFALYYFSCYDAGNIGWSFLQK